MVKEGNHYQMQVLCKKNQIFILIIFAVSLLISCTRNQTEIPPEKILVKIGNRSISVNEYIERVEYTIRPAYCKSDNNVHKKIILNSLIAEKLLALEAGPENDLVRNEHFQRYMQGRKEQAMRQWLYYKDIHEKVKLNPAEIKTQYQVAGRKYKINYFTIKKQEIADSVAYFLFQKKIPFDTLFYQLSGNDSIPQREVEYKSPEIPIVHQALFTDTLQKNQILGPLKTEDGVNLFIKIDGWTESLAISEKMHQERWDEVTEKLKEGKALQIYDDYVSKLMKGKRLEFAPDVFDILVNVFGDLYLGTGEAKKELFLNNLVNKKPESDQQQILQKLDQKLKENRNQPFFTIDHKIWTVGDFERELEMHPLVFRKTRMKKNEFSDQFRYAIADMLRDRYITREAYEKDYDQVPSVQKTVAMWHDSMLALYQKYHFLSKFAVRDSADVGFIEKYLNPYIDELQKKYSDQIEINVDLFNNTKLTRIDLFVLQKNVPYPVVVPAFPQVTTDIWLDYGKKM
jgi:hypothetical protein